MSTSIQFESADRLLIQAAAKTGNREKIPVFDMVAYNGGKMKIQGWRAPLVIDLLGMRIVSQLNPVRVAHDPTKGVGHTEKVFVNSNRLFISGVISRDTPWAREVIASGKKGFPWRASIGVTIEVHKFIQPSETIIINGQNVTGPVFHVQHSTFDELSFVDLADDRTSSATITAESHQLSETILAHAATEAERHMAAIRQKAIGQSESRSGREFSPPWIRG